VQRSKQLINPITYNELKGIAAIWVNAALALDARDLRMMQRLIKAQNKTAELG
jgi:DSF synthase